MKYAIEQLKDYASCMRNTANKKEYAHVFDQSAESLEVGNPIKHHENVVNVLLEAKKLVEKDSSTTKSNYFERIEDLNNAIKTIQSDISLICDLEELDKIKKDELFSEIEPVKIPIPKSTKTFEDQCEIKYNDKTDMYHFYHLGNELHRDKSLFQCKIAKKKLQKELNV